MNTTTTTTTTTTPTITIEKDWDGNESIREGRNGRTYVSRGRWRWFVLVDGVTDSVHDTKRDATGRVAELRTVPTTDRDLDDFLRGPQQSVALDTFVRTVAEIDALLSTIKTSNDDHYAFDCDRINWGHVGNAQEIRRRLQEIVDGFIG